MSPLERYWLSPLPAVRPWLVRKAILLVFAFDVFADHLGPAWRYGTAGFNVAHFGVLDWLPPPTSAFYVGTMILVGLAAFVCALLPRPPGALVLGLALAYLWSWSCSMHDSFQHHYLLSLFFLAFAFFPSLSSRDLFGLPPRRSEPARGKKATPPAPHLPHGAVPRASSWAMVLVWTTASIVYLYTAVSKTEPEWLAGDALRNITHDGARAPALLAVGRFLGLEGDTFWWAMGHSVVLLQIGISVGYATAALRDSATGTARRVLDVLGWLALVLSLSFHAGAEYMQLRIGWFSGYMILLALATFTPAHTLSRAALLVTWPARELAQGRRDAPRADVSALGAMLVAALLVAVGMGVDLPGALSASMLAAVGLLGAAVYALVTGRQILEVRAASVAAAVGALVLAVAIRTTGQRYDYWRFAGGDFRRRGEWALALHAYERAEAYAPEGESRRGQAAQMRQHVRDEGPRRPPR